ncbi:MAG: tetratricopeptide repeat protein [Terracidiphilus sp.]|jgi:tetratricopeptide (TPR) repeat protein
MRNSTNRCILTAIAVISAIVSGSPAFFSQTTDPESIQIPIKTAEIENTAAHSGFQPTPEDVGDAFMIHQRYQAAIEAYQKASPDSASLENKMGIAYELMFSPGEATRCYKASLKLNPKNVYALNNLGTIYDSLRQFGDGERMYRKALKVTPDSAVLHKNLGTNLLAQQKYKQGWEYYKTALAEDPQIFNNRTNPHVENPGTAHERGAMNYYMARGCVRAGENDKAIDYLRKSINDGFADPRRIVADSEFASLRGSSAFQDLVASQRNP